MNLILNFKYEIASFIIVLLTALTVIFVSSSKRSFVYKTCDFFDSKIGSLIITILGVYWAAQVSLYATELRNQISAFSFGKELSIFIFVISLLILSLLMKEQGQSRRIKIKEQKLNDQLTNLPPKRILTFIATENEIINHMMQKLRVDYFIITNSGTSTNTTAFKKNSDLIIKYILKQICSASSKWDDEFDRQDIFYSANIFIPAKKEALLPIYENEYPKNPNHKLIMSLNMSPFFLFNDNLQSKIDHSDGILFCQKQYTVTLKDDNISENKKEKGNDVAEAAAIGPMVCFPYVVNKEKKHNPNFFGAVSSFVNKEIEYISNSREVMKNFLTQLSEETMYDSYVSKSFIERVRAYYKDDEGKSILSIPLNSYDIKSPTVVIAETEVHAVVNLYRNKNGMLLTKERAESFCELIRPLCCHLSLVLSLNKELESICVDVKTRNNEVPDKEKV